MGLRWLSNCGVTTINILLIRAVFPLAPVAVALYAGQSSIGLFNRVELPAALVALISFALLDLSSWVIHYSMHKVPLLWRLHAVHHSDPDYDFSTGLRFHPMEAITTFGLQTLVILALGAPAFTVLVYKLVNVFMSTFAHGNLKIHAGLEGRLRKVLVTPDLHRIHHSSLPQETDSNFSGITPVWDRVFGTYIDQPQLGHDRMEMGLKGMQSINSVRLHRMLLQPFSIQPPVELTEGQNNLPARHAP
jgi:sterol desaturase/sphingolipid hydroxylase (fatty acid hydroxylase superfamily)